MTRADHYELSVIKHSIDVELKFLRHEMTHIEDKYEVQVLDRITRRLELQATNLNTILERLDNGI